MKSTERHSKGELLRQASKHSAWKSGGSAASFKAKLRPVLGYKTMSGGNLLSYRVSSRKIQELKQSLDLDVRCKLGESQRLLAQAIAKEVRSPRRFSRLK